MGQIFGDDVERTEGGVDERVGEGEGRGTEENNGS
jgi:hypothetical protein